MNELAFFDTNVLVYTDDASVPKKQERAIALLGDHTRRGSVVVSLQVLQEYFVTVTRKLGLAAEVAQRKVEILACERVVRFDVNDVIAGIEIHRLTQVPFWDALIVHAARLARAKVLYSEDFQDGAVLGGVRVVNPFL